MSKIIRETKVRDSRKLIRALMQKTGRPFVVYIYKILMSIFERNICATVTSECEPQVGFLSKSEQLQIAIFINFITNPQLLGKPFMISHQRSRHPLTFEYTHLIRTLLSLIFFFDHKLKSLFPLINANIPYPRK